MRCVEKRKDTDSLRQKGANLGHPGMVRRSRLSVSAYWLTITFTEDL